MSLESKLNYRGKGILSKIKNSITTKAIAYGLAASLALGSVYGLNSCKSKQDYRILNKINPQKAVEHVIGESSISNYSEIVTFPDPNLESVIRREIRKPTGDIYGSDLLGLINLSVSNIFNLSGLECAINLTYLYLNNNQITDISPLSGLTNLTELYLYNNQITDISPLSGLTKLTYLDLYKNQITDISPLSGLTNLTYLYLNNNQITDISSLSGLTKLIYLGLSENQITNINISSLSGLTNLTWLDLYNNQITDIRALVDNPGINLGDVISIFGNPLSTIACQEQVPILMNRGVNVIHTCL